MRHRRKMKKLSRSRAQRKALIKSLLRSLLIYERITTTESKAKALRPWIDRLIVWAKEDTLSARRRSYQILGDHKLVRRLFTDIGPRFKGISGGTTRIIDYKYRKGDGAKLSIFELTKREVKKTKAKKGKGKEAEVQTKKEKEVAPAAKEEPKKGLISNMRKIFKKEKGAV